MSRHIRIEYPGAVYHITSRLNDQQPIYEERADRTQFLCILEQACQ